MKDLYKTLGVAEDADDTTIKKTYRKLAKEFHPDVTGGDKKKTERFKEINEAYGVLGDKQKRTEYDRLKHAPVRPNCQRRQAKQQIGSREVLMYICPTYPV